MSMTVKEMQAIVDEWIGRFKEGYRSPLAMLASLTEEVGELSREINHHYGEKPKKPEEEPGDIAMELADVMFVIVCFANSLNIDIETAFQQMMNKFHQRDSNRWTLKDEI